MQTAMTYIPEDRRLALAQGRELAQGAHGAALFADISGFTALTEALAQARGPRAGADEATRRLNEVYNSLIGALHQFGGAVISFSGDGMLCWFDENNDVEGENEWPASRRALGAAFALQQRMRPFAAIRIDDSEIVQLGIKTTIASGQAQRFLVGEPTIQMIDVLVGAVVDRTSAAEQLAAQGETLIDEKTLAAVRKEVRDIAWRLDRDEERFALVHPRAGAEMALGPKPSVDVWSDLELPPEQAKPWLLPAVANWLSAGHIGYLGELRPAVALFVRINGLDTEHDPDAPAKLDAYVRWVQQILAQVEGSLIQVTTGDKGSYLYAAFGAPVAHNDDPRRAATVAQKLRHPPDDLAFRPVAQIGMARGRMRVGAYGSDTRRTFGVQGPAVNLAAGLMMLAEPGQILLDEQMAATLAPLYLLNQVGSRHVKGRQGPMLLHALGAVRSKAPIVYGDYDSLTIFGRVDALRRLHALAEQLRGSGQGSVVRIEGEAGIGKSRLVTVYADRLKSNGFTIAAGAGRSVERNTVYLAARQIGRWLLGLGPMEEAPPAEQITHVRTMLESLNPEWLLLLPLLGDLLDLPIPENETTAAFEPQLRRAALITLTIEIIQSAARVTSLVLLVEDAQWLDEASLDMLTALARVIERTPVLLLIVHRPGEPTTAPTVDALTDLPNSISLSLEGLDRAETEALVESRLKGLVSPLALDLVDRQAQGNPFFCEELVDALRAAGDLQEVSRRDSKRWELAASVVQSLQQTRSLVQVGGEWRLDDDATLSGAAPGLPDSIHGAVLARYDRLREEEKLTLKVASVIGRTVSTGLVQSAFPTVVAQTEIGQLLDRLAQRSFLRRTNRRAPETFEFSHNITQEIVYRLLLEEQRQDLHLRVGQALERSTPNASDVLAHHFYNASMEDPAVRRRALEYLDKAAQRARFDYANEAALFHLGRALALDPQWRRWAERAEVLHILGQREEEEAALTQLDALPETPPFQLALAWADLHDSTSNYAEAIERLETALDIAQAADDLAGEARCLARLGLIAWRQGAYATAETSYRSALDRLNDGVTGKGMQVEGEEADARYGLGLVYRQQGRYDDAQAQFEAALATYHSLGNRQNEAKTLIAIGHIEHYRHHLPAAMEAYSSALSIYRITGDRASIAFSLVSLAQGHSTTGQFTEAKQLLHDARDIHDAIGDLWWQSIDYNELGFILMREGQFSQAQSTLDHSLAISQQLDDESGVVYTYLHIGQVKREQGLLDEAKSLLLRGLDLTRAQGDTYLGAHYLLDLSQVFLKQNQLTQAEERANASSELFTQLGLDSDNIPNLTTLALIAMELNDRDSAKRNVYAAGQILQKTGGMGVTFPQREYLICSSIFRHLGDIEEADRFVETAFSLVQQQASNIGDPEMERAFLENLSFNREILAQAEQLERSRQSHPTSASERFKPGN